MNRDKTFVSGAFTLVELLVVISIIALLISILLPSLKKARATAKRTACAANVRSIAQAGLTYATDDPNEFAIPVGVGDTQTNQAYTSYVGFGGKSGLGPSPSVASTSIYGGSRAFRMGSIHRPLNRMLYKDLNVAVKGGSRGGVSYDWQSDANQPFDIFHCPGDKGFPGMHYRGWRDARLSGYDYFGTSYSCNPYLIGFLTADAELKSNSIYLRPMSRVPSPSDTILFAEFAMRFAVFATNREEYDQSPGCWPFEGAEDGAPALGHHDKPWHFTVSFGDGHASWIKIKGYGTHRGVKLSPSCSISSCACIVQRGRGWRVDTLPSELVKTDKLRGAFNGTRIASQDGNLPGIWGIVPK